MIAAVLLLLIVTDVTGTRAMVQAMPSLKTCEDAQSAYLAGPPDAHAIQPTDGAVQRAALCVTVPVMGRTA